MASELVVKEARLFKNAPENERELARVVDDVGAPRRERRCDARRCLGTLQSGCSLYNTAIRSFSSAVAAVFH